jgi:hypothetical protein
MIACLLCSTVYELQARAALVSYLTLEIVFGETLYDLARNRTDSPSAFSVADFGDLMWAQFRFPPHLDPSTLFIGCMGVLLGNAA